MTKLSEKLAKLADAGGTLGPVYGVMADDARAIEERAEAAEAKLKWHEETQRTYYDVEARAAAAEAEAARLREYSDFLYGHRNKAIEEGNVMREKLHYMSEDSIAVDAENEALRAKLEKVRAEVARLVEGARSSSDYYHGGDCVSANHLEYLVDDALDGEGGE